MNLQVYTHNNGVCTKFTKFAQRACYHQLASDTSPKVAPEDIYPGLSPLAKCAGYSFRDFLQSVFAAGFIQHVLSYTKPWFDFADAQSPSTPGLGIRRHSVSLVEPTKARTWKPGLDSNVSLDWALGPWWLGAIDGSIMRSVITHHKLRDTGS